MRNNPIYSFDTKTSLGINEIPLRSLFQVNNEIDTPELYFILDDSSLTNTSTVQDLLDIPDAYATLSIDLSPYLLLDGSRSMVDDYIPTLEQDVITKNYGDTNYLNINGETLLVDTYTPTLDQSIATKLYIDTSILGMLKSDGSVLMDDDYIPELTQDIATKIYIDDSLLGVLRDDGSTSMIDTYIPELEQDIITKSYLDTELLDYLLLDGSRSMGDDYTPILDQDIGTKTYIDTLLLDRLKSDGSISMNDDYSPSNASDICTKEYVDYKTYIFTDLVDTPINYTNQALKHLRVNSEADAIEFIEVNYTLSELEKNTYGWNLLNIDRTYKDTPGNYSLDFSNSSRDLLGPLALWSTTFGENTLATGDYSMAIGYNTMATNDYSFTIGSYNDNKTNSIFEIGIGNEDTPTNALEVLNTGEIIAPELNENTIIEDNSLITKKYHEEELIKALNYFRSVVSTVSNIEVLEDTYDFIVDFTLDDNTLVFVDGIIQDKDSYEIIGSKISFYDPIIKNQYVTILKADLYNIFIEENIDDDIYTITPGFDLNEGVIVYIDGVLQSDNVYTIDGNDINFDESLNSSTVYVLGVSYSYYYLTLLEDENSIIETTFSLGYTNLLIYLDGVYLPDYQWYIDEEQNNILHLNINIDNSEILILKG